MMNIIAVFLYIFWVFVFVVAATRIYEIRKYRGRVAAKDWLFLTIGLILPIVFFVERFVVDAV